MITIILIIIIIIMISFSRTHTCFNMDPSAMCTAAWKQQTTAPSLAKCTWATTWSAWLASVTLTLTTRPSRCSRPRRISSWDGISGESSPCLLPSRKVAKKWKRHRASISRTNGGCSLASCGMCPAARCGRTVQNAPPTGPIATTKTWAGRNWMSFTDKRTMCFGAIQTNPWN